MALQPEDVNRLAASKVVGGLSCFHLNIRSANHKQDLLNTFLDQFCFEFDIIMLTETWMNSDCEAIINDNYHTFHLNRKEKRGGGVLLNNKKCIACDLLPEYCVVTPDAECLAIVSQKYIIAVMYRPPDGIVDEFIALLEGLLNYARMT